MTTKHTCDYCGTSLVGLTPNEWTCCVEIECDKLKAEVERLKIEADAMAFLIRRYSRHDPLCESPIDGRSEDVCLCRLHERVDALESQLTFGQTAEFFSKEIANLEAAYEVERSRVADEQMRWSKTYAALRKYGRHTEGRCCGFNGCPDEQCQCVYKGCVCGFADSLKETHV